MLVHADRDPDVVLAHANCVGTHLNCGGGGGTGVEHVDERDAREPHEPGHGVGIADLITTTDTELNILPFDAGVAEGGLDGLGAHLHRGLVESTERV